MIARVIVSSIFALFCTYGATFATATTPSATAQAKPASGAAKTMLIVGDSLSAAYGLKPEEGWVALLQKKLDAEKRNVKVVNGSVSGDTTANGRARLPVLLAQHKPSLVVIALGGNDGLRGGAVETMRSNLDAMTSLAKTAKAKTVIVGVQIPPNYGPQYTAQFEAAFKAVADKAKAPLVPSILSPLGTSLDYFQPDKIHPNAAAQAKLLAHLWPTLEKAL